MSVGQSPTIKPLTTGMRVMLFIASGLVFAAGVQLFVLTEMTERYFAWTIRPPLTAAFLGAAYWSSCIIELVAARERTWARARTAIPAVLLFTTLTLIVTLIHRDRFHFGAPSGPETIFATWVWLAIYAFVPIAMTILLVRQLRAPGVDAPRLAPMPDWLRAAIAAQATVMLVVGGVLLVAPQAVIPIWPWLLTALTGRAVGAWLLGLGIAAAQVVWENDFARSQMVSQSSIAFGLLELIALARYPRSLDWTRPGAWVYLFFILSIAAVGLYGWLAGRRITQQALTEDRPALRDSAARPG